MLFYSEKASLDSPESVFTALSPMGKRRRETPLPSFSPQTPPFSLSSLLGDLNLAYIKTGGENGLRISSVHSMDFESAMQTFAEAWMATKGGKQSTSSPAEDGHDQDDDDLKVSERDSYTYRVG